MRKIQLKTSLWTKICTGCEAHVVYSELPKPPQYMAKPTIQTPESFNSKSITLTYPAQTIKNYFANLASKK